MKNKIKNAIYKFMYGRNGIDELSNFVLKIALAVLIPTLFIKNSTVRTVVDIIFWIIVGYGYFRTFSKNVYKRREENEWFKSKMKYFRTRLTQRKEYRFYDCPKCHTHLRVPKGAGKITITCKKCGHQFDRKA